MKTPVRLVHSLGLMQLQAAFITFFVDHDGIPIKSLWRLCAHDEISLSYIFLPV
jgi:hypothetical protein